MSGRIRATRTEVDGHMFASKREAKRYAAVLKKYLAGEIDKKEEPKP